jgi:hypothetical protein
VQLDEVLELMSDPVVRRDSSLLGFAGPRRGHLGERTFSAILADQLSGGELALATAAVDPSLESSVDLAPRRPSVDVDPVNDGAFVLNFEPVSERLSGPPLPSTA